MPRGNKALPIIDAEVVEDVPESEPRQCDCDNRVGDGCEVCSPGGLFEETEIEAPVDPATGEVLWETEGTVDENVTTEPDDTFTEDDAGGLVPFEQIAQLATTEQIEAAFARSLQRIDITKRLKAALLSMTNHFDWVAFYTESDPDGKPYLQGCGCDKVMHAFGIEMEHDGGKREDNKEGGFEYVYTGRVRARAFSDIWYDVIGSRWSDDGFFTKGGKYRADPGDVRKAGHTNFMNRAIKTALGIRSMTWEEIEAVPGMEKLREKVQRVGFSNDSGYQNKKRGHAEPKPGEKAEVAKGPRYEIKLNANDVTIREQLKKAIRPGDRNYTGAEGRGGPPYTWIVKHTKETVKRVFDFAADNPSAKVKPIDVPPDEMP